MQYQVNLTFDLGKQFLVTGDIVIKFKATRPAEFVSAHVCHVCPSVSVDLLLVKLSGDK